MPKEVRNNHFIAIRSMFISGSVKKMRDIEELYPTLVAKALRINHSRYIKKLYNPQEFTVRHLVELASIFEIDIQLIWDVISRQISPSTKSVRKK
jgi:hypothetical protein